MVAENQKAPDFRLPDQNGVEVSLSSLKGQPVVLYFYPKDNTPGCTKQACGFRDHWAEFEKLGARVVGVSPDNVSSHRKFAEGRELPFTLLADTDHRVCEDYGVWKEKSMFGKKYMGIERTTFLLDAEGNIRKIFPKVKVLGHASRVLKALQAL